MFSKNGYQMMDTLTFCMMGNFSCFFCRLLTFFKITFSKTSFKNTIRVSNGLDPDQDRNFVGPNLGTNCLQRLSADKKVAASKERVKMSILV